MDRLRVGREHGRRPAWTISIAAVAALALLALGTSAGAAPAPPRFAVVTTPSPAGASFGGVSTLGPTEAWAVGSATSPLRHGGAASLTEHWNGTAWTVVPSPDTLFNDDNLVAVREITPSDVWAVGNLKRTSFKSPVTPMAFHWDGAAWTNVPTPAITATIGTLAGVTATSTKDVWAVGTNGQSPLAEHWNGSSWTIVPVPLPGGGSAGSLAGVSATGPSDVWAVGTASGKALAEHWNGSAWSVVRAVDLPPQRPGASVVDHLSAVTAISPTNVWAVGGSTDTVTGSLLPDRTLVEHWDGTRWTLTASPAPATHNFLTSVAATSATDVWAIGADWSDLAVGTPVETPLILHWNGSSWSAASPPAPVGTSDNFIKGAAAAPGVVWAVGAASGGTLALRHTP